MLVLLHSFSCQGLARKNARFDYYSVVQHIRHSPHVANIQISQKLDILGKTTQKQDLLT